MTSQKIAATPPELQKLVQRFTEAHQAKLAADHAHAVAVDVFTMFCEGKDISGATFAGIEDGHVLVTLPAPELVEDTAA